MASGPKGREGWCLDDTQKALAYRRLLAAFEQRSTGLELGALL